jgi:hypothetical protein
MSIPGAASPLFLATTAGADAGFVVTKSLRINDDDTANLSRTPSSASNRKTWTWSAWIKRGKISVEACIFTAGAGTANTIRFNGDDRMKANAGSDGSVETVAKFRDPSAWYHIVVALDTTQATASNRLKIYVNSVLQDVTGGYPTQNGDGSYNEASVHYLGRQVHNTGNLFDGYLAEINFIDGQALAPTDFGETDGNGVWQAKDTSDLTFGTNGFRLEWADNSGVTATTLGKDTSGGSNNWTPHNLSVTAGAGNDSLFDSPSNGTQADTGAGGQVSGNYMVWNPVDKTTGITLSNGNLQVDQASGTSNMAFGNFGLTSGKWYWEVQVTLGSGLTMLGIADLDEAVSTRNYQSANGLYMYQSIGSLWGGLGKSSTVSNESYGSSWAVNDIMGIALDMDNGNIRFYKNGSDQGQANSVSLSGKKVTAAVNNDSGGASTQILNTGQRAFAHAAPSGHKALNTANLPPPTIADGSKHFDVATDAGANILAAATGKTDNAGFVWIKDRVNGSADHILFNKVTDSGMDGTPHMRSNSNATEATCGTYSAPSGNSVGWVWNAGSSTVTNNDGSITTNIRSSASTGFSIIGYTGNGTVGATIGHNLNSKPEFFIFKIRSDIGSWYTYHKSYGATKYLTLDRTHSAVVNTYLNNTEPTSSIITLKNTHEVNGAGQGIICYAWTSIPGYSSVGSYTGNGSATDGTFVPLDFKPAFVMGKRTDGGSDDWFMNDTSRLGYNPANLRLYPNLSNGEGSSTDVNMDMLSNGFKLYTTNTNSNGSGATYAYIAFASHPFASNGGLAR